MQPGKCLFTTVRELVENSLDAAESIGTLPDIEISMCARPISLSDSCISAAHSQQQLTFAVAACSEEVSQKRLNSIRGVSNHERLDEELYQDFETEAAKKAGFEADVVALLAACYSHLRSVVQRLLPHYQPAQHDSAIPAPLVLTWLRVQKRLAKEAKEQEKLEKAQAKAGHSSLQDDCLC